jgi:hypothetical protein
MILPKLAPNSCHNSHALDIIGIVTSHNRSDTTHGVADADCVNHSNHDCIHTSVLALACACFSAHS